MTPPLNNSGVHCPCLLPLFVWENDVEDYHRKYSEGSSILPYKEWEKTWTMDRQANMQVNPKEEMAIRAMVAKMKAAHEKNDIRADMRLVSKTHNECEQMH